MTAIAGMTTREGSAIGDQPKALVEFVQQEDRIAYEDCTGDRIAYEAVRLGTEQGNRGRF